MASISNGRAAAPANGVQQQQKLKQAHDELEKGAAVKAKDYALAGVRSEAELQLLTEYAVDYAHTIGG